MTNRTRLTRAVLAALALGGAASASAAKLEPPLSVSLRVVSSDAARGRHRLEMRLRSGVAMSEPTVTVRVRSRAEATAARAPEREPSVEAIELPAGREVRRQFDVLTLPGEPVTVMVGLGGAIGRARLHRTASVDLGPEGEALAGRPRTDQHGRGYYEVRQRSGERP